MNNELAQKIARLERELAASREAAKQYDKAPEMYAKQKKSLVALHDVTLKMATCKTLDDLLQEIVSGCACLIMTAHVFLYMFNEETNGLELRQGSGLFAGEIGYRINIADGLAGKVFQTGLPMVVNDYQAWEGKHPDSIWDKIQTIAGVPVMCRGKAVGVVGVSHD
ncbi:MAG: GAF domain-containing protein, partial [Syntrophales bacterium LBB04]|nr:GAF domain-containing protein [Syntrophales bacterium LBB04]